jgi:hypothetical protein
MLIVLADERDAAARRLVECWAGRDARLMAVRDLCAPGWQLCSDGRPGRAVIGGETLPCDAIAGVVTRLPCVRPGDLPQIVEADREYVAAELGAFLLAWLDGLACPVINRPSAGSLMGPPLSQERWLARAARAGLAYTTPYRAPGAQPGVAPAVATVVGDRWFGMVAPELGAQAVRLAREAGVELATVRFSAATPDAVFGGADLFVDITPEIADALLARLTRCAGVRA